MLFKSIDSISIGVWCSAMLLPLPVVSTNDVLSHAQSLFNPRQLLQSHFQCCSFIWFILPAAAATAAQSPLTKIR